MLLLRILKTFNRDFFSKRLLKILLRFICKAGDVTVDPPVLDSLNECGCETAGVVTELPPAGGAVEDPGPAALTQDVAGRTAGDGQRPGNDQTHRTLHYGLQVTALATGLGASVWVERGSWKLVGDLSLFCSCLPESIGRELVCFITDSSITNELRNERIIFGLLCGQLRAEVFRNCH